MLVLGVAVGEEFTGQVSPEMLKKLADTGEPFSFVFRAIKYERGKLRMGFGEISSEKEVVQISRRPVPGDQQVHPPETEKERLARRAQKAAARALREKLLETPSTIAKAVGHVPQ